MTRDNVGTHDSTGEQEFDDERREDVTWRLLDDGDPEGSAEALVRRAALPNDTPLRSRIHSDDSG